MEFPPNKLHETLNGGVYDIAYNSGALIQKLDFEYDYPVNTITVNDFISVQDYKTKLDIVEKMSEQMSTSRYEYMLRRGIFFCEKNT